ncbi:hypothetical protein ACWD62_43570 [Streptomyces sp. NPDC005146]
MRIADRLCAPVGDGQPTARPALYLRLATYRAANKALIEAAAHPGCGSTSPSSTGCAPWPCDPSAHLTVRAGSIPCAARSPRSPKKFMESVQAGRENDIVDDFSYPLPVTVICRLLGVPREDEPLFRAWSDALVAAADVRPEEDTTKGDEAGEQARVEMGQYLMGLAERRCGHPGDDMLSAFVNEPDPALRLTHEELAETAVLLIAGYETTVNLITNGVLMLR